MSIVDELCAWSAIAGRMTNEMELNLAYHAETRTRNELIIDESESFMKLMRNASSEWQRALGALRREYAALGDRISEDRRRAAADFEVEEMRRVREMKETAAALRREVDSLSALRDRLREEIGSISHNNSAAPGHDSSHAFSGGAGGEGGVYRRSDDYGLTSSQVPQNASSPIPAQSRSLHGAYSQSQSVPSTSASLGAQSNSSLGVLRSVREQLREIRENNTVSPTRAGTPQRAVSPSAQQWKERLAKLQGDLRTLRSELGTTPQRAPSLL